ncbi:MULTISPECIES: hypothetical protein [unclassified Oceanispirochaeta]|uniref:hypothetical protein n=1 Tax=unclassified Oceanispirochaeta TaxID=2635722 RepID=UPI000E19BF92|nr:MULTISPECIES: hypothetical protein [unclassified Oceanispirochaeta]MBF9014650.1 hypothetical protein [Oceanispirochaeta sp. M2]NPD70906.1 hypothetical protein [Oceanispirochaeta sp. M1]RDG33740.1 hypothetical protein DV872_02235 [Oceanispirochaeta sp. M1]
MEKELIRELEEFKKEKERVKQIPENPGGSQSSRREKIINIGFILVVLSLFIMEITTHFQFWIHNSIERHTEETIVNSRSFHR